MKKLIPIALVFILFSCSSTKQNASVSLYEILKFEDDGGAKIQFYEILTEENEIKMLLSDPLLKKKIKPEHIQKCNFLFLNMGELPQGKYGIAIEKIEETAENIIIQVKEIKPSSAELAMVENFVRPYAVVKINSKKNIIIN